MPSCRAARISEMPSLPGGEYPRVARDQPAVLAHQRRRRPAPLLDARRDRRDLGIGVGPCISGVWDEPIDRPPLDLVGRPRPLISRRLSRVRARAARRSAIDYSYGLILFKAAAA